eukprot:g3366.t1
MVNVVEGGRNDSLTAAQRQKVVHFGVTKSTDCGDWVSVRKNAKVVLDTGTISPWTEFGVSNRDVVLVGCDGTIGPNDKWSLNPGEPAIAKIAPRIIELLQNASCGTTSNTAPSPAPAASSPAPAASSPAPAAPSPSQTPIDCTGSWTSCDSNCVKEYRVSKAAEHGGKACSHSDRAKENCKAGDSTTDLCTSTSLSASSSVNVNSNGASAVASSSLEQSVALLQSSPNFLLSLLSSLKDEHLPTVRWGLKLFNPVATENKDGKTALQLVCALGRVRPLEMILDHMKRLRELNNVYQNLDDAGRTVLMMAAANGHFDCVRVLGEYQGLNKRWWSAKDQNGKTARDYAVARRHTEIVSFLDGKWTPPKEVVYVESAEDLAKKAADIAKYGTKKVDMTKCSTRSLRAAGVLETREVKLELEQTAADVPTPLWDEVKTCLEAAKLPDHRDWKRDLLVERRGKKEETSEVVGASTNAETGESCCAEEVKGDGDKIVTEKSDFIVDPALWFCNTVQVLKLQLPVGAVPCLSPKISQLAHLTTLIITGNAMQSLPSEIGLLSELKIMEAGSNSFTSLPEEIGKCAKLEVLELSGNKLTSVAPLKPLRELVSLHADNNQLTSLDGIHFKKLKRLVDVSASHNNIEEVPEAIGECSSLQTLNLSHNKCVTVPAALGNLGKKKLVKLLLNDNPIKDPKLKKNLKKALEGAKDLKEALKWISKNAGGGGGKGKKKKKR